MSDRPFYAKSFGLVLYLIGKGYEPLRAEMARDGSANIHFVFSPAADDEVEHFHELKDRLNTMSVAARRSVDHNPQRNAGDRHVSSDRQQ